ncbi:MAG: hypothetical protein JWO83_4850 [Caulobacteraceae bacterium]|nr:hypothetical protein [Caulobacteraceae bacterium]
MVVAIDKLERFFRRAGAIDVDKSDLGRYEAFVNRKLHDLLIRGEATAKANGRDIVQRIDLPVTKGLQECLHHFEALAAEVPVRPALEEIVARPPLDLAYDVELEAWLPELAGGLSVAIARSFRIVDPEVKNPSTEHWERTFQLFDLLL